jgi:hypothetical protein
MARQKFYHLSGGEWNGLCKGSRIVRAPRQFLPPLSPTRPPPPAKNLQLQRFCERRFWMPHSSRFIANGSYYLWSRRIFRFFMCFALVYDNQQTCARASERACTPVYPLNAKYVYKNGEPRSPSRASSLVNHLVFLVQKTPTILNQITMHLILVLAVYFSLGKRFNANAKSLNLNGHSHEMVKLWSR